MHDFDLSRDLPGRIPEQRRCADLLRLKADLAARGHPVTEAIVLDWSEGLVLAVEETSAWVYGPSELDPARGRDGRSVVPAAQLKQLRRLAATNLPSQRTAIAHQIPLSAVPSELVRAASAGPYPCGAQTARALVGPPPAHPGLRRAVRTVDAVLGGAGRSVGPATWSVVAPLLDPIIFAVVAPTPPRPGDLALWIPLTAWRW